MKPSEILLKETNLAIPSASRHYACREPPFNIQDDVAGGSPKNPTVFLADSDEPIGSDWLMHGLMSTTGNLFVLTPCTSNVCNDNLYTLASMIFCASTIVVLCLCVHFIYIYLYKYELLY